MTDDDHTHTALKSCTTNQKDDVTFLLHNESCNIAQHWTK